MSDTNILAVRRSVSIPIISNGESVLAVAEIGARLWSKDVIYRKFFENGIDGVKKEILEEIKRRGGSDKEYELMLNRAKNKLLAKGLLLDNSKNGKGKKKRALSK